MKSKTIALELRRIDLALRNRPKGTVLLQLQRAILVFCGLTLNDKDRIFFGSLLRRLGLHRECLRALKTDVYSSERHPTPFLWKSAIQYASSLAELGAPREALRIFDRCALNNPEALHDPDFRFLRGLSKLHLRRYSDANLDFQYSEEKFSSDYFAQVSRSNRWLCRSFLDVSNGIFLEELYLAYRQAPTRGIQSFLSGLILATEVRTNLRIPKVRKIFPETDLGFYHKLLDSKTCKPDVYLSPGRKREWDFIQGLKHQNTDQLFRVHRGSPFPEYKSFVENLMQHHGIPSNLNSNRGLILEGADWEIIHQKPVEVIAVDLQNLPQRLIQVLASDFYHRSHWVEIFDQVFRSEVFQPPSSSLKFRQLMIRARNFLRNFGVTIQCENQKYFLFTKERVQFQFSSPNSVADRNFQELPEDFSRRDLKVHPRMAQRWISDWLETGKIFRVGAGRSVCYKKRG